MTVVALAMTSIQWRSMKVPSSALFRTKNRGGEDVIDDRRLFQTGAAATGKASLPMVLTLELVVTLLMQNAITSTDVGHTL